METFGDKLKHERQERGLTRGAVAHILRIDEDRVSALERNDFDAMPKEVAIDCLRGYAGCLSVDAELVIEDYLREREKCLRRLEDAITELETAPVTPARARPRPGIPRWLVPSAILAGVATLGVLWMLTGDGTAPSSQESVSSTAAETTAVSAEEPVESIRVETPAVPSEKPVDSIRIEATPTSSASPVADVRPLPEPTPRQPAPALSDAPALTIPEFGVGTAVRNRQLVGRSDRFAEGGQVWFWTHVKGGTAGDTIDHVWLRDGVEAARISLNLGGPRWRTQSVKTLHQGSAGEWAVEARDAAGHVLARQEFACLP